MTDNEIIKALECCTEDEDCSHCPSIKEMPYCSNDIMVGALNFIKRQQAEIERLQNTINDILDRQPILVERAEKYAKSDAIKEFADRLKEQKKTSTLDSRIYTTEMINSLVKEMIGEKE